MQIPHAGPRRPEASRAGPRRDVVRRILRSVFRGRGAASAGRRPRRGHRPRRHLQRLWPRVVRDPHRQLHRPVRQPVPHRHQGRHLARYRRPAADRQLGRAPDRRARGQPAAAERRGGRPVLRPPPRPRPCRSRRCRRPWPALVRAGKAKAAGFSEIAPTSLLDAHAVHPVAAVQSEYSLQTRAPDLGLRAGLRTDRRRAGRVLAGRPRQADRRPARRRALRRVGLLARQCRGSSPTPTRATSP